MIKTGLFSARSHRGGYTLVFFAMIMFALMGLSALVIDIGFARLTQRQMQTAVDSAALEGLRFRDGIPEEWLNDPVMKAEIEAACGPHPALPQNPGDPDWQIWLNCVRRWAASRNIAFVFDDDLDPSDDDGAFYDDENPDPNVGQQFNVAGQFGAGPVLEFTDGAGSDPDLAASEFINDPTNPNSNPKIGSYPATPVYKPTRRDGTPGLELNLDNTIYGDMVAGSFDATTQNVDFNPPEGDTNPAINEYSNPPVGDNYVQRNFRPSAPATANAFLVRMRRSNNLDGLDEQQHVSTHGPTVPYLFGRGSLLAVRDPEMVSDYLPRRHGMTVRATAICDASPAMTVGPSLPSSITGDSPLSGLAPFALHEALGTGALVVPLDVGQVAGPTLKIVAGDAFLSNMTTLDSGISDSQTTVTVTSRLGLRVDTPFHVRIDDPITGQSEIVLVESIVDETTWGVIRASNNSTAHGFPANAPVVLHRPLTIGIRLPITYLAIAATEFDTQIVVTSAAEFPPVPFSIRINGESLRVTAINGNVWTVSRARDGTASADHNNDSAVSLRPSLTPSQIDLSSIVDRSRHEYIPVYRRIGGETFVVGFRRFAWSWGDVNGDTFKDLDLVPVQKRIANENASTVPLGEINEQHVSELISDNQSLSGALLAPASVR